MDREISPNAQTEELLRLVAREAAPVCCASCGAVEYVLPLDDQPLDAVFLANYSCDECDERDEDRDLQVASTR